MEGGGGRGSGNKCGREERGGIVKSVKGRGGREEGGGRDGRE
jgi:hypothetical protein